jgi:hypothetical protein
MKTFGTYRMLKIEFFSVSNVGLMTIDVEVLNSSSYSPTYRLDSLTFCFCSKNQDDALTKWQRYFIILEKCAEIESMR